MYKICSNIILTDLNGEMVASRRNDPAGNILVVFNEIGQLVIRHLANNHTVEIIVEDIYKRTGMTKEVIGRDILAFLNQLVHAGIIEVCG